MKSFINQEQITKTLEETILVVSLKLHMQNKTNYTELRCLLDIKMFTQAKGAGV